MPLGEILTKSFNYAKNNRAFWFYGFLLALFSGGGYNSSSYSPDQNSFKALENIPASTWIVIGIVVAIVILVLIVISAIVSSWSLAAIMNGTNLLEKGKEVNRKIMGKTGKRSVWKLIVLNVLIPMAVALALILLIILGVVLFAAMPEPAGAIIGIVLLVLLILALIPVIVYFGIVWGLASRFVFLEQKNVIESIKLGMSLIKGKFWWTFLFTFVVGMIGGFAAFILVIPLILVVLGLVFVVATKIIILAVILGFLTLVLGIAFLFASGLIQAFAQIGWTLWWMELKKLKTENPVVSKVEPSKVKATA